MASSGISDKQLQASAIKSSTWLDTCLEEKKACIARRHLDFAACDQNAMFEPFLFGVIGGNLELNARQDSVHQLTKNVGMNTDVDSCDGMAKLHGYVIGGLGAGESRKTREQILTSTLQQQQAGMQKPTSCPAAELKIDATLPRLLPFLGTPVLAISCQQQHHLQIIHMFAILGGCSFSSGVRSGFVVLWLPRLPDKLWLLLAVGKWSDLLIFVVTDFVSPICPGSCDDADKVGHGRTRTNNKFAGQNICSRQKALV